MVIIMCEDNAFHSPITGGYLAIQLGLSYASAIRAVVAAYPMLDLKSAHWTTRYDKTLNGQGMLPASIIDQHLAAMDPEAIVTRAVLPARLGLAVATVQQGRLLEFLGEEQRLFPEEALRNGAALPPLFLFHGAEDTVVPVVGSERFVEMLRGRGATVHFVQRPAEHGFDLMTRLSEGWLREGMEFVTRALNRDTDLTSKY